MFQKRNVYTTEQMDFRYLFFRVDGSISPGPGKRLELSKKGPRFYREVGIGKRRHDRTLKWQATFRRGLANRGQMKRVAGRVFVFCLAKISGLLFSSAFVRFGALPEARART